jgi:hypothetical protein
MWMQVTNSCIHLNPPGDHEHLFIKLPSNFAWDVDEVRLGPGGPYNTWIRNGDPTQDVSVITDYQHGVGSINIGGYHGLLWKSELINYDRAKVEYGRLRSDQQEMLEQRVPFSFPPPRGGIGKRIKFLHVDGQERSGIFRGFDGHSVRLDIGTFAVDDLDSTPEVV